MILLMCSVGSCAVRICGARKRARALSRYLSWHFDGMKIVKYIISFDNEPFNFRAHGDRQNERHKNHASFFLTGGQRFVVMIAAAWVWGCGGFGNVDAQPLCLPRRRRRRVSFVIKAVQQQRCGS